MLGREKKTDTWKTLPSRLRLHGFRFHAVLGAPASRRPTCCAVSPSIKILCAAETA